MISPGQQGFIYTTASQQKMQPEVWISLLAQRTHLSLSFSLTAVLLGQLQSAAGERQLLVGVLCVFAFLNTTKLAPALEQSAVLCLVQWYARSFRLLWKETQEPVGGLLLTAPLLALVLASRCTWAAGLFARRTEALSQALVKQLSSFTMLFVTTDALEVASRGVPEALMICGGVAYLVAVPQPTAAQDSWLQHLQQYLQNAACRAAISIGLFRVTERLTDTSAENLLLLAMGGAWFWSGTAGAGDKATYQQCRSMFSYNLGRLAVVTCREFLPAAVVGLLALGATAVAGLALDADAPRRWWWVDSLLTATALQLCALAEGALPTAVLDQLLVYALLLQGLYMATRVDTDPHHDNIAHEAAPNSHAAHLH